VGSNPSSISRRPNVIYETEGQKIEGKNPRKGGCHAALTAWHLYSPKLMVEARGVEPLSETISTRTSPGAALIFLFPHCNAQGQAVQFGSFISSDQPQSFG